MIKNFLNPEGHHNPLSGSKVMAILLKGWIWPIVGASAGEDRPCSLRRRLVFSALSNLRAHQNKHKDKKPHQCTLCDKTFFTRSEVEEHVTVHTGKKSHTCTKVWKIICVKVQSKISQETSWRCKLVQARNVKRFSKRKKKLRDHIVRHSAGSFSCPECNKDVRSVLPLKLHIKMHKEAQRPTCSKYNEDIGSVSTLRQHMKIHNEDQMFTCPKYS